MSSSKKNDLYRHFAAGVYLSEAQNPIPPLTKCIRVYSMLINTGKGGGVLNQSRGASVHKAGPNIPT
jgi:hypothetical protein